MRNSTANNRESPRIAFFLFRPLDLRSRPYAPPYRLRVVGAAERKMLENPRRGFSLKNLKSLQLQKRSRYYQEKTRDAGFPAFVQEPKALETSHELTARGLSTQAFRPRGTDQAQRSDAAEE